MVEMQTPGRSSFVDDLATSACQRLQMLGGVRDGSTRGNDLKLRDWLA